MNLETLKLFCDQDKHDNGNPLASPFTIGFFTYATNRKLAIRVGCRADVPDNEPVPIRRLFREIYRSLEPIALTSLEIPPLAGRPKCKHCGGSAVCKCGFCSLDPAKMAECSSCDGTGHLNEKAIEVTVGHHAVSHFLLNLLKANLPNVQIHPHPTDPLGCLYFTFDGGDGIMMPMKADKREATPNLNDEQKFKLCRLAITHLLLRIEGDEKVRYHLGAGTTTFNYLTAAAAVLTGKTHGEVMDETIRGSAGIRHQTIAEIMKTLEAA